MLLGPGIGRRTKTAIAAAWAGNPFLVVARLR